MADSAVCPFCRLGQTAVLTIEGLHGDVVVFHCSACNKNWSEILSPRRRTVNQQIDQAADQPNRAR